MKYHSEEAQAKIKAHPAPWTPERQEVWSREWRELIAEAKAAANEDPAGPKAQALAERWLKQIEKFTMGDPEILAGMRRTWADQENWPAQAKQQVEGFFDPDAWSFIRKAIDIRKQKSS